MAVPFLISAISLYSNAGNSLPWVDIANLPWQITKSEPVVLPSCVEHVQPRQSLKVCISPNGAVNILDKNGLVRLRSGLPGRPLKVWRDYGNKVVDIFAPIPVSTSSSLQRSTGGALVDILNFCPVLKGLLWILCDDNTVITVIKPATSQVIYIPLPPGQDLNLSFHPDHIEAHEEQGGQSGKKKIRWSLYWLTLISHFIRLDGNGDYQSKGTALFPFGK